SAAYGCSRGRSNTDQRDDENFRSTTESCTLSRTPTFRCASVVRDSKRQCGEADVTRRRAMSPHCQAKRAEELLVRISTSGPTQRRNRLVFAGFSVMLAVAACGTGAQPVSIV